MRKEKTIAEHMRDVLIETDSGDGKGKYSVMWGFLMSAPVDVSIRTSWSCMLWTGIRGY